jgi:hypothetical protein
MKRKVLKFGMLLPEEGTTMKKQISASVAATILLLLSVIPAGAYNFYIDNLLITKSGTEWYNDAFGDNMPPPQGVPFASEGWMGHYIGNGIFPYGSGSFRLGTEANGKLLFDSQYAAVAGVTVPGYKSWVQNARLKAWHMEYPGQAPIPPADYLFKTDIFTVSARFDLITPDEGEVYALRLYDPGVPSTNPSGGLIELRVRRALGSTEATVQFRKGEYYQDGGKTWLAVQDLGPDIPLDLSSGWDQIDLAFDHSTAGSKDITASFTYYDLDGVKSPVTHNYGTKGTIFNTQEWTDVEFQAGRSVSVAEPTTMLLLGLGLIGLAGARRKFKKYRNI